MEDINELLKRISKPSLSLLTPSLQECLLKIKFYKNEEESEKTVAYSYLDLSFPHMVNDEDLKKKLLNMYHEFYTEAVSVIISKTTEYLSNNVDEDSVLTINVNSAYDEKIVTLVNTISSILTGGVVLDINTKDYLNEEEPESDVLGDKYLLVTVQLLIVRSEGENEYNLLWSNFLSCWVKSVNGLDPYERKKYILL